jgi:hypothetical protein
MQAKFIYFIQKIFLLNPGTSVSVVSFQVDLIDGLARWNLQRLQDSMEVAGEKVSQSLY